MPSSTLSGEVQKKGLDGVWRTVLLASGHSVYDRREWSAGNIDPLRYAFVNAPYVPGKVGAFRSY